MTGNTPIRFGMHGDGNSNTPDMKVRNFSKFAKNITIQDIFNELGGENKLSNDFRNTVKSLFDSIAGQDGEIDKKELTNYFKQLDKAAENGKYNPKDILSNEELYDMEASRGNAKKGWFGSYDGKTNTHLVKFVKALISANDKIATKEAKIEAAKKAEAADLARRTSYDKQGNRIVKYDDKTVVYSGKSDHVMKEIVEDKDYVWTTKYLKDDKVTQKTTKQKDGSYSSVQNYYYDKNGTLTKTIEKINNGNVYTRHYYKSGNVSKEIYKDSHTNDVSESYYRDGAYNPYKEVKKDKAGNIVDTTTYKNTTEGNHISSVTKNADGKTTHTTNYDKNGGVKSETSYYFDGSSLTIINGIHSSSYINKDANGKVVETEQKFYDAKGRDTKSIKKDANGKVTETEQYFYDAKGREAKIVKKDADGNITETSTTTYGKNSSSRTETRSADGNLKEVYISNKNKTIYEDYKDNQLLRSMEESSGGEPVLKNAAGEVITWEEYRNLSKPRIKGFTNE